MIIPVPVSQIKMDCSFYTILQILGVIVYEKNTCFASNYVTGCKKNTSYKKKSNKNLIFVLLWGRILLRR